MCVPQLGTRLETLSSTRRRDFLDLTVFEVKRDLIICVETVLGFMGASVTFFDIQLYAPNKQIWISILSYPLLILNATSIICRLISNFFVDGVDPLNVRMSLHFYHFCTPLQLNRHQKIQKRS